MVHVGGKHGVTMCVGVLSKGSMWLGCGKSVLGVWSLCCMHVDGALCKVGVVGMCVVGAQLVVMW